MYKKNSALQIEYDKMRYQKMKKNQVNITKKWYREKMEGCGRVQNFMQQLKQGPYYTCTICH